MTLRTHKPGGEKHIPVKLLYSHKVASYHVKEDYDPPQSKPEAFVYKAEVLGMQKIWNSSRGRGQRTKLEMWGSGGEGN